MAIEGGDCGVRRLDTSGAEAAGVTMKLDTGEQGQDEDDEGEDDGGGDRVADLLGG